MSQEPLPADSDLLDNEITALKEQGALPFRFSQCAIAQSTSTTLTSLLSRLAAQDTPDRIVHHPLRPLNSINPQAISHVSNKGDRSFAHKDPR
jgi:hypothetical protein